MKRTKRVNSAKKSVEASKITEVKVSSFTVKRLSVKTSRYMLTQKPPSHFEVFQVVRKGLMNDRIKRSKPDHGYRTISGKFGLCSDLSYMMDYSLKALWKMLLVSRKV